MDLLDQIVNTDILKNGKNETFFVGHPFLIDYSRAHLLICDAWKHRVKGIPQGAFLLAYYEGEAGVEEAVLLRALGPTKLPTDNDMIASMVGYYKDNQDISGRAASTKVSKLDQFTRYEFSFSGLECRVLGAFYRSKDGKVRFGADLENFYSAHNYKVFKSTGDVLQAIVNQRDGNDVAGSLGEFAIGHVRYSSSLRFQESEETKIKVFVSPKDFMGKRTALFGMTRTGKSNTVKKIIEATADISNRAQSKDLEKGKGTEPYTKDGKPSYPIGQIIFDVNGEYANPNLQDEGTAIYELYAKSVTRYSVLEKEGFKVMKVNFYKEISSGFGLIASYFEEKGSTGDYVQNFLAVDLEKPEDYSDNPSAQTRYDRIRAAYLCCLFRAGFKPPVDMKVRFTGNKEINDQVKEGGLDPKSGIGLQDACNWFDWVWNNYLTESYFIDYKAKKGRDWADDDLKALLVFLTMKKVSGGNPNVSGFKKLRTPDLHQLHTTSSDEAFEEEIPKLLRKGDIVIVDLSQGSPTVQRLFSEKICQRIFADSMARFIGNKPNNFIQFYFEEAHNLFPKKEDKDLSQIYNRIAKEGAKLYLGMIYATQEVSSISSNILKNTQNWFIAHLNNEDEIKELRKYYDFGDFTDSLIRFSASNDKGFVRMKTYTNPFVVPVQVDRFLANRQSKS